MAPARLAEIEPFPSAVLAHHYPDVPNLGDMTRLPERIASGEVEAPDVFCGGTPCQAFSVAGLRKSLDDARGNLSLTFCEIANAIDAVRAGRGEQPAVIFWENVPGVLSTKDNAFGCFLAGLAGEDGELQPPGGKWTNAGAVYGPTRAVAWRILDAQYFGVAQRRRRVFVVASARKGFDPAAVLFEFDGLRRDTAPSRETWKAASASAARSVALRGREGGATAELGDELAGCLRASGGGGDKPHALAPVITMAHGQGGAEIGYDRGPTLTCNHEAPIAAYQAVTGSLTARGGRNMGQSNDDVDGHKLVPVAFPANLSGTQCASAENIAPAMGAKNPTAVAAEYYSHDYCHDRVYSADGISPALNCSQEHTIRASMQVRRLTPVECEKLQGFPENYTAIPWRKKPADQCPDGPRYKALGNSWAVPNVRWIGARIDAHLRQLSISNDNTISTKALSA